MKKPFLIMMMVFWAAMYVAGCATPKTCPPPTVTNIPVPTPCVSDKTPPPPVYADDGDALKNASPGDYLRIMKAAELQRRQRLAEIEPLIASCR